MIKIFKTIILVLAAVFFGLSVFFTPYQEVQFQFIPGREPLTIPFNALALLYTGLGLITAVAVGLLDRLILLREMRTLKTEKKKLQAQTAKLRSLLAEDRESDHE